MDEIELWVQQEIQKCSRRTMAGDHSISVADAEKIAMVAAQRARDITTAALANAFKQPSVDLGDYQRDRFRTACLVAARLINPYTRITDKVGRRAVCETALAVVDEMFELVS